MKDFTGRLIGRGPVHFQASPEPEVYVGVSVLFRGYIANVATLAEESRRRGETLADATDGRLFAAAYRWWGEHLQAHVLGEYAIAVFDEPRSRLLLTHDALGILPLFYRHGFRDLTFSSHLDDLARLAGTDELDEEYIADYLTTCSVMGPRTPYVGVRRLAPGQSLCWANHTISLRKTWDITRVEPVILDADEDYEERFRVLLREAIDGAVQPGEKVWSELSGGLDSSSLVSVAVHCGMRQLEAVSVIYTASTTADERPWMKSVLRQYRLPWHTLDADASRPFSELPPGFCAEPLNALPNAALLRRYNALAKSHGVDVILSGHGGDQVCCGGAPKPYYLADLLPFHMGQILRALHDWQLSDLERRSIVFHLLRFVIKPFIRYWTQRSFFAEQARLTPPWIHPRYLRRQGLNKRARFQAAPRCRSPGQQYFVELIWRSGFSPADDRDQPFAFRYPLFYRPLVEFMLAIPWEQKIRPGLDRHLQRRALKGILPEPIRQRLDKRGPAEAETAGLRNGSPWTELLLNRPHVVERGYVDANLWREAVNRARFGGIASMRHFLATATLEVWLRRLADLRRDGSPLTQVRPEARRRESLGPDGAR